MPGRLRVRRSRCPNPVWVLFGRGVEDHQAFLPDPAIPAMTQHVALSEPPVKIDPLAQ